VHYLALYRKYRPQTFAEIVGQRHVTETLAREVTEDKIAHAYLFAGPRGTGKTTTARIIAKALNCENRRPDGEPDNECGSCRAITEGSSLDVIELDAASHNKVEDVREIRVNAGTVASIGGAKRVYILDEAHMLSRAAGNALLKILEEPPQHVHFVLATTEPYKLLDTIRSRSQRFDFHPVGVDPLVEHLTRICELEGYQASPEAKALIAEHAKGSVRDALSLLEQVAVLGDSKVEADLVTRALGLVDKEVFGRLVDAISEGDAPSALQLVAEMASQGADLRRFVVDSLGFFRGLFLAQYTPNLEEVVDESPATVDEWRTHGRALASADVLRAVDQLSDALVQLREGREERLVVELAMLRLTRPETAVDPASLVSRLDRLEERLKRPQTPVDESAPARPAADPAQKSDAPFEAPEEPEAPGINGSTAENKQVKEADSETEIELLSGLDLDTFEATWPALVARIREDAGPRRHALFREVTPVGVESGTVVLSVPSHLPFHLEQLRQDEELRSSVEEIGSELLGGPIKVDYRAGDTPATPLEEEVDEVPTRAPAKTDLVDEADGGIDPTELLTRGLGGKVVEE
jgi:DNA polymerase-3 subunit gamma/tau